MKYWRKYNRSLIPLTPPHLEVDISQIKQLISKRGVYFARWTTEFDCKNKTEFWHIIHDTPMEIEDYSRNTRNQIRKSMKYCHVEMISKEKLIDQGFEIYISAFKRYKTHLLPKTKVSFIKEIETTGENWDFWGIFNKGKMIGYCKNKIINDYCEYRSLKLHPDYLELYPSYILFFRMNQYYLKEKHFQYVNNGTRSLSHQTNIQDFLIQKFKFRKAYCKLNMMYVPWVQIIITVIYPFRFLLNFFSNKFAVRLSILIKHEEIRRSFN